MPCAPIPGVWNPVDCDATMSNDRWEVTPRYWPRTSARSRCCGQITELPETRVKRTEMEYGNYGFDCLPNLESTVEDLVRNGTCRSADQAYVLQAWQKTS